MPDTPEQGTDTQNTQGNDVGGASPDRQSTDNDALSAAEAETKMWKDRYTNLNRKFGQQGQELGRLRGLASQIDSQDGYSGSFQDTPQASTPRGMGYEEIQDQRLDLIQYRQETPDWQQYQEDVDKLVNDDQRIYEVVRWKPKPDGSGVTVDWYATFKYARDKVELDRFRAAKSNIPADAQSAEERREEMTSMAHMSGNANRPEATGIDVNQVRGKSAAEIAKIAAQAGLIPQNDPPSSLR